MEPEPSSAGSEESLSAKNAELQGAVAQLTRDKEELQRKIALNEEYTKRVCAALKKLKGTLDGLVGQSALIAEVLSPGGEAERAAPHEAPQPPQSQAKKKMQTASVLPMVRGFPIRRIIIPLQRLNINSHRHRPNRIHGHRREPWWREAEQEAPEPLQEAPLRPGHGQRVPVRRLQRSERRPHRAVVRPRARPGPGARRGQEAAAAERAGVQNRRGGSSHQMLQAVVLLQRLSLTQHQQHQQRREPEPQPLPAAPQTGDGVPLEPAVAATASVEAEPADWSVAGPSSRGEAGGSGSVAALAEVSADTGASPSDGPEAEAGPCRELPPVLTPAEQGEFTMPAEEETGERAAEPPPPPLSPLPPCGGGPAEAPRGEPPPPQGVVSEMEATEAAPNGDPEATADTSGSDDTSAAQAEPAHLHNGETAAVGQSEVVPPEPSDAPSPAAAGCSGADPPRSPSPQEAANTEEPLDYSCTPSGSRKRKASASVDSPDKSTRSPRSDVEREQSPQSGNEQSCRPRRRCAIRTNYALFFAGWNAD